MMEEAHMLATIPTLPSLGIFYRVRYCDFPNGDLAKPHVALKRES